MQAGAFQDAKHLLKVTISGALKMTSLPAGLFDGVRLSLQEVVLARLGVSQLAAGKYPGVDNRVDNPCLEGGALDDDCCSIRALASCTKGYTYTTGAESAPVDCHLDLGLAFKTICTYTGEQPSPVQTGSLFEGMSALTAIEISCCDNLQTLQNGLFGLERLQELKIVNNPALSSIEAGTFATSKQLTTLVITGNRNLARLEAGTFDHAFDETVRPLPRNNLYVWMYNRRLGVPRCSCFMLTVDKHSILLMVYIQTTCTGQLGCDQS